MFKTPRLIVENEHEATLQEWLEAYGYLLLQKNGHLWLSGLVKNERQAHAVTHEYRRAYALAQSGNGAGAALRIVQRDSPPEAPGPDAPIAGLDMACKSPQESR